MRAYFNSDNYAPVLPEVLASLAAVNEGHEPAYGADRVTKRVEALLRREFGDHAHAHGMRLHVDGARLTNAAAALGVPLRAITTDAGADVVSFGGTKAGLMLGEAVVLLGDGLEEALPYLRKQSMQLASKMRYVAAQFEALLTGELWRGAAERANAMAARLAAAVEGIEGVRVTQAVQANVVFAVLPPGVAERLQPEWGFYTWDEHTGEVRWMCAHDTRAEDVDAFAAAVAAAVG